MRLCSVDGCKKPVKARGYCMKHYSRVHRRGGDPAVALVPRPIGNRNNWKGDDVGYVGAHERLYRERGKASEYTCPCGEQAAEWAFDAPTGHSADVSRYTPMCKPCHNELDGRKRNARTGRYRAA